VFNRRHTIAGAIASVQSQSHRDFELIVIDDGSTDDTREVVASLHDPRIRLLVHGQNRGAAAARNTGLEAATGRYIAFLDSDDSWHPDKLERQLSELARLGSRTLASCTGFVLHRQASGLSLDRIPEGGPDWFSALLEGCFVSPGTTLMAERSAIERIGVFDTELRRFEDWDWLLRYLEHYDFVVVRDILARVNVAGYAPPAVVAASSARLFQRQRERVARLRGSAGVRLFRASLLIEQTVAYATAKRYTPALGCLIAATAASPPRVARFFSRAARKIGGGDY
jgi:glycosyltransferase involved in cell wall biosynthesis